MNIKKSLNYLNNNTKINYYIVLGFIITWGGVFGLISVFKNENFWFSAYDVTKQDQTLWLLSRFKNPFNTIRGMNAFGDHAYFFLILLSPIYYIFPSINVILFLTPIVRGLSLFGIFLISKEKTKNNPLSLFVVFLMFLNPAFGNVNLDHFYPETWVTAALVFVFYFAVFKKKWIWVYILFGLSLLTKEDVPLIFFMFGIYLFFFEKERKHGIVISVVSIVYFVIATKLISYFAGTYTVFDSGGQMGDLKANLFNIHFYIKKFTEPAFLKYIWLVGGPLLFLSLLRPQIFFISLPAITANMVSGWPYLKTIDFHYTIYITPFLFIALVYVLAHFKKILYQRGKLRGSLLSLIIFFIILTSLFFSSLFFNFYTAKAAFPVRIAYLINLINYNRTQKQLKDIRQALKLVDHISPISADTFITSHLSHREKIYNFPVPWIKHYYGYPKTVLPNADEVKYVLVRRNMPSREQKLLDRLILSNKYVIKYNKNGVLLLEKNVSNIKKSANLEYETILYETFENQKSLGEVRVWSGKLDERKITSEKYLKEKDASIGHSFKLVSTRGMDAEYYYMIRVKPSTFYKFSGWLYNKNMKNINANIYGVYFIQELNDFNEYNPAKVTATIKITDIKARNKENWIKQETQFFTGSDTKQIKLSASFASWGQAKGELYIDEITLNEIINE